MTIAVLESAMAQGRADLASCATNATDSLNAQKAQDCALLAAWQGTGAGSFQEACSAVEDALGVAGSLLADVGLQVGKASTTFTEADDASAKAVGSVE